MIFKYDIVIILSNTFSLKISTATPATKNTISPMAVLSIYEAFVKIFFFPCKAVLFHLALNIFLRSVFFLTPPLLVDVILRKNGESRNIIMTKTATAISIKIINDLKSPSAAALPK